MSQSIVNATAFEIRPDAVTVTLGRLGGADGTSTMIALSAHVVVVPAIVPKLTVPVGGHVGSSGFCIGFWQKYEPAIVITVPGDA